MILIWFQYSKTVGYLLLGGGISIYIVKTIIKSRRDSRFKPEELIQQYNNSLDSERDQFEKDYYSNIAQVRPGFPLPQNALKDSLDPNATEENTFQRRSKYEAGAVSHVSRKRGDKLGFWDRRNKDD